MHGYRLGTFLMAPSALCALLFSGCRAPQQRPPAASEGKPLHTDLALPIAPARPGGAQTTSLRAGGQGVTPTPAELLLGTDLIRHSFTTTGLDFDPDVCDGLGLLVFASTRQPPHPDIFLAETNGTMVTQLTDDPADDIEPRFSPDGDRIAFASNRSGNWDIWTMKRDGTDLTQLTQDSADEIAPAWSPDGTRLAYCTWSYRSHQWEIWLLSTTNPRDRRFVVYGMFPAWSPDGGRLAFQRARERGSRVFSIWTVRLGDDEPRDPTELAWSDAGNCIAPTWSSDGSKIIYCRAGGGPAPESADPASPSSAELWLVSPDNGSPTRLSADGEPCFNPIWAGDDRVYFVSTRSGTENVWSLKVASNAANVAADVGGWISRAASPVSSATQGN